MAEFSAHTINIESGEKVAIVGHVQLYVSTFGNDFGSGTSEGDPFLTPQRALEWLSDKFITESGFVTINFAPGIYDIENVIEFDHPQGERVAFVGAPVELLLLKYVDFYKTTGYTAAGLSGFYSGVLHGITLACCYQNDNTIFETMTTSNQLAHQFTVPGCGVLIEDYTLTFNKDYNPAFYYAAYPYEFRNNIARQASILGCHKLTGAGISGSILPIGKISIESSIRDSWFTVPMPIINGQTGATMPIGNTANAWTRFFGNPYRGNMYDKSSLTDAQVADTTIMGVTSWLGQSTSVRSFVMSSIPVGYYGTNSSNGNPLGATSNVRGFTFPTNNPLGGTAAFDKQKLFGGGDESLAFTATGPAGTLLNDAIRFGPNHHVYSVNVSGLSGEGSSAGWKTVNQNDITVKIVPTVFRRNGTILSIKSGGLRKIKNIFFDGKSQPFHYGLLGSGQYNTNGYSNKSGIYANGSKLGETVVNEPIGLGTGLFSNVGFKDFHVGVYCDRSTNANLGIAVISNCSYGVISNNASYVNLFGSICTGSVNGFCSFNGSTITANRCFSALSGHSITELKLKDKAGSTSDFTPSSFNPGQTYASPDGKIRGTVYHWDVTEKTLSIAIRTGALEGRPGTDWAGAF
jgi:hypothetical protein